MEFDTRARTAFLALAVLFLAATLLMTVRMQHPATPADGSASSLAQSGD